MKTDSTPNLSFGLILLCFFLSGFAGLNYQVVWSKALGLIFGHTVYAIATVLAVFMGGLALGSAVLGRWTERTANCVTLYGWVELGVAVTAALSQLGLYGVRIVYGALYPALSHSPWALIGLRFLGAALVLFLPTFLMGGTLPILVRGVTRSSAELGARISRLYWVNTAGAVAGTMAAGFLLLPGLGLWRTLVVGILFNVTAGGIALWIGRTLPASPGLTPEATAQEPSPSAPIVPVYFYAAFALVGATAIAYEVAWTRLLATTLGSSTYAFTLMLATFLSGIVVGSFLFEAWLARGGKIGVGTFAATQTLTALALVLFLLFDRKLPEIVPPILVATGDTFWGLVLAQFVTCAMAMLPAAILFGFNFPLVTLLLAGGATPAAHGVIVGRAYAANTLGAIAGAMATGFWLLPQMGAFRLLAATAIANLLLAISLELHPSSRRTSALVGSAAVLGTILVIGFSPALANPALTTFNPVVSYDRDRPYLTVPEMAERLDVVFAEEGLNATISVVRRDNYQALRTNGKVDASVADVPTQLMLGHLGAIFHAAPRRVLIIGFGSGMTASAVARYPEAERIDCVEIEPAVLRAAAFLQNLHREVLQDKRVHLILDDGRNFLLTTPEKYDLIISEPSNPWIAGIASLFTSEFYREARARLRPGGMFVQWVQAYNILPEDLRMILATFAAEFPQVTMWRGVPTDLILVGQTDAKPLVLDRLQKLWVQPLLRADYQRLGLRRPEGLLAFYCLDDGDLRKLASDATHNTDDHTLLEYRGPRGLLAWHVTNQNVEMVRRQRSSDIPRNLILEDLRTASLAAVETLLNLYETDSAARLLIPYRNADLSDPAVGSLFARLGLLTNHAEAAIKAYGAVLKIMPDSLPALAGMAEMERRQRHTQAAEEFVQKALQLDPNYIPALESKMLIERDQQHWSEAIRWQQRRLMAELDPVSTQYTRLGELLAASGDLQEGERALKVALEKDSYEYAAHRGLASLYIRQSRWREARQHLETVVRFHPDVAPDSYLSLAAVYRELGELRAAASTLRKGFRIFPEDPELKRVAGRL